MSFSGKGNPLPVLAGFLAFQVSGWFMGERIFDSMNSEAMLFTFLFGGVLLLGWLLYKQDSYSSHTSYLGRTVWITCVVLGVFLGLYVRMKM
jgi:hypothetical protein